MTPPPEKIDQPSDATSDRELWRRVRLADARLDECDHLLDLAAFAEGRLDPDETERIAAWLDADPDAAADVSAARAPAHFAEGSAAVERIIARAGALQPAAAAGGVVLRFARTGRSVRLQAMAQWGSLAAALALAAWLGFTMGSDASLALSQAKPGGDSGIAVELFDPASGFPGGADT
jgi:hypothetical protein